MKKILAGLLLAATFAGGCKSDEVVDLKFNLPAGSNYKFTTTTDQSIDQTMGGSTTSMKQNIIFEMLYKVKSVADGVANIDVSYDRIKMGMAGGGMDMKWDSRDSAGNNPLLSGMGMLLNKPFQMQTNTLGKVISVSGFSAAIEAMMQQVSPEAAPMQASLMQSFSDSAIRKMLGQVTEIYPEQPVKVGDTWKKTMDVTSGPILMMLDNTYKLNSVSGGVANVTVDSKITTKPAGDAAAMQGMSINLKGTQKGDMKIEVATGLIQNSTLKQDISGDISANGTKIPMSIKSDITTKGEKM
jgi:hypothetical protein